jgi:hypothetical protein
MKNNCRQQRVLQYWGRSNTHQHWFAIWLQLGQKFFNVAFCSYLHLQYFNWAAVPAEDFQIPQHRKALSLPASVLRHPTQFKTL